MRIKLYTCDRGVTAIEFAIIAPVLFLLLMGTLEFLLMMYITTVLEGATGLGSRLGRTGYTEGDREQFIRTSIAERAPFLDPDQLTIYSAAYTSFDDIGQPEPCIPPETPNCVGGIGGVDCQDINGNGVCDADMGRSGAGGPGDVVVYFVNYPWTVFTPIVQNFIGEDGIWQASAVAVARNESFDP